jgi:hypothetical protein
MYIWAQSFTLHVLCSCFQKLHTHQIKVKICKEGSRILFLVFASTTKTKTLIFREHASLGASTQNLSFVFVLCAYPKSPCDILLYGLKPLQEADLFVVNHTIEWRDSCWPAQISIVY